MKDEHLIEGHALGVEHEHMWPALKSEVSYLAFNYFHLDTLGKLYLETLGELYLGSNILKDGHLRCIDIFILAGRLGII